MTVTKTVSNVVEFESSGCVPRVEATQQKRGDTRLKRRGSDEILQSAYSISTEEDFFFQDKLTCIFDSEQNGRYLKRDFLFRSGEWRGEKVHPPDDYRKLKVLVVGHSDYGVSRLNLLQLYSRGFRGKLFASNFLAGGFLTGRIAGFPLPLGLTNPTSESDLHVIYGNFSQIREVLDELPPEKTIEISGRIYANFDWSTAPRHRQRLWNWCQTQRFITVRSPEPTLGARLEYLREMRNHGVVVCPRGNGHDTVRFYEALYVGAIPVVLKGSYSENLAQCYSLPHISLRSWHSLENHEDITSRARELRKMPFTLDALRASFWKKKLLAALDSHQ